MMWLVWPTWPANYAKSKHVRSRCCGNYFEIDSCCDSNLGGNINLEITLQISIATMRNW